MARRSTPPPTKQPATLSPGQTRAAIPKLERRISALRDFDLSEVGGYHNPAIDILENQIQATLAEIFPPESLDYERYLVDSLYHSFGFSFGGETSPAEINQNYRRGFEEAIAKLESAVVVLTERLEDLGESDTGRALRAIEGLDLHPEIERASGGLFRDDHYANAVEDACKALNTLVKLRSGRDDLDGVTLMQQVFSEKSPTLQFNDLRDDSDRSEQRGMMHLYIGAMAAFRNPRAHKIIQDDPERALEYIAFISLLAKLLDQAKKA